MYIISYIAPSPAYCVHVCVGKSFKTCSTYKRILYVSCALRSSLRTNISRRINDGDDYILYSLLCTRRATRRSRRRASETHVGRLCVRGVFVVSGHRYNTSILVAKIKDRQSFAHLPKSKNKEQRQVYAFFQSRRSTLAE